MATKKTYYIEFGDGKGKWFGTQEVESDMRYSNALQDGNPIEDETHAILAALHIYDASNIETRPAAGEPGFSKHSDKKIAVMCVRTWCDEEEIYEDEEE